MMKKVLFFVVAVLFLSCSSYADTTFPCDSGTLVWDDPTYNPLTGAFQMDITLNDCKEGDATMDGTVGASGTVMPMSTNVFNVDIDTELDLIVKSGGDQGSIACTGNMNGTYTISTEKFNGDFSLTCSGAGTGNVDVVELFLGPITLL